MNARTRHTTLVSVIAVPMLLFAVMPWFFGASGLGSVVGSFLWVMAALVMVALGRASGRAIENPTPGAAGREAGLALVLLVLIVLALAAPSRL